MTRVNESDRRLIRRGTLESFLIQGGSVALVFSGNLFLVRSSDPDSYGLYVHVFNWVSILSVVVMWGRDDLVLVKLPRYAHQQHERLVRFVRGVNRRILAAGVVVGLGWVALLHWVPLASLSDHQPLFRVAMIAVYLTAALGLNQFVLQALNHIRLSQVVEKLLKPLLLIIGVGLLRLLAVPFDARVLVILSCVVLGICCGVVFWLVVCKTQDYRAADGESGPAERHGVKTTWFFLITLFTLLATKITMLMLPLFHLPPKDIGIFNISYRFADVLIFPFFLMHTVLPQLFARHVGTGRAYTQSLFSESNRLMTLLSLPLLLVIVVGGRLLLGFFGPEFTVGYAAMIYISLGQFLFSFFGPANTILMMQDREKYSAGCLLFYVVVLAGTSWWLIPVGGITGGALAILISSGAFNIVLAIVAYRLCGVRSPFLAWLMRRDPQAKAGPRQAGSSNTE
ncbi:MAG TPA: polysaccharide biosynthesis C-terminal domain-containing protein [Puia sp.]|nr:polysaccharide biosynthesis C-terminal domain-containing protein [Puia sp.]